MSITFERSRVLCAALVGALVCGCSQPEPVLTYTIPTVVPEQLEAGKDRMLAAMVPHSSDVWFFKITGSEKSVEAIETLFREFVEGIQFSGGVPVLKDLPDGWRRGGDKPMRYATIDVQTPMNQLDLSVSKLSRQSDWDEQVKMNVNRWRGQLGLDRSDEKWAEADVLNVAVADTTSVWVDLVGESSSGGSSMTPPFAGASAAPFASAPAAPQSPPEAPPSQSAEPDPRLKFDRPDGWRDGRMSSMRMAAFAVGPEDSPAEITVIPAGGDLRGNVARWLGQVLGGTAPDDVVDQALADAKQVKVIGRDGQRFLLKGEDPKQGTAIDATIVPMDGGMSLFVKMTGPVAVVEEQSDAIGAFLKSLKLDL